MGVSPQPPETGTENAARRARLHAARRRPGVPWWRWLVTACLGLGVLVATFWYFEVTAPAGGSSGLALPGAGLTLDRVKRDSSSSTSRGSDIEELTAVDRRRSDEQREIVMALARRHVGAVPGGDLAQDIRILQAIVDAGALDGTRTYELQALGVVLGDMLKQDRALRWVIYQDRYGRSRALASPGGDVTLFPVTMLSKRIEAGLPVEVQGIYDEAVEAFEAAAP